MRFAVGFVRFLSARDKSPIRTAADAVVFFVAFVAILVYAPPWLGLFG